MDGNHGNALLSVGCAHHSSVGVRMITVFPGALVRLI
jgi:hypothetical protein